MFNKKQIVILGNGQLGKACYNEFGNDSILFTRDKIDFSDISNLKLNLHILLDDIDILCMINCAAYTNVDKAENENRELADIINGKAVETIGLYCKTRAIPLLHFSTDFIFDGTSPEPYNEKDEPNPINGYGASKLLGEKLLLDSYDKVLIFRIAWVYSVSFNTNFVSKVIIAMSKNSQISIPDDQIGNLCNVFDLSKLLHKIVDKIVDNEIINWGIYNIAPLEFESRYSIVKRILKTSQIIDSKFIKATEILPISTQSLNSAVQRPLNSRLNSQKLFDSFGLRMPDWIFSLHNATQKIIQRLEK
jgi:dTDP-4-dehydrorhamnose reductase